MTTIEPGSLLLTPPDVGERSRDVLCVFDHDPGQEGAFFALVLTRPTEAPAQPLAFALFHCGDDVVWWGGPSTEPFALVEFVGEPGSDGLRPDGSPRPFVTDRTAVFFPAKDHPPKADVIGRRRIFHGSVWLSPEEAALYLSEGIVATATESRLFDDEPDTLAQRLRAEANRDRTDLS